jgi:cysteine-rich repeat protein
VTPEREKRASAARARRAGRWQIARCGDGLLDVGEVCEDGNTRTGDGCDADCQVEAPPPCGDSRKDAAPYHTFKMSFVR